MDVVLYGQLYNEAMVGMDTMFDDMRDSLKNFSKKNYPDVFEGLQKKYGRVFMCVEEIYNEDEDKEAKILKRKAKKRLHTETSILMVSLCSFLLH